MKVRPLVFTPRPQACHQDWKAETPFGTLVFLYKSYVDDSWYWGMEIHKENSYPPEKRWCHCKDRIEAERQANDWYANVVRSCLDD